MNKRKGKKKVENSQLSPEHIVDYICFNYPQLGLGKIKDKVIVCLKCHK